MKAGGWALGVGVILLMALLAVLVAPHLISTSLPESGSVHSQVPPTRITLAIAATGDLKGTVTRRGGRRPGGLAHLAGALHRLRQTYPYLLLLDAGDAWVDDPEAEALSAPGAALPPLLPLMNDLGYDAMALGNRDISGGWAVLDRLREAAKFPVLAANLVMPDGAPVLPPYAIVARGGVRVAVLGLTSPAVSVGLDPTLFAPAQPVSLLDAVRNWVPRLRQEQQADVVIALAHAGLNDGYEREAALRGGVPGYSGAGELADETLGLDLVISGGAHKLSPLRRLGSDDAYTVPVLETGAYGEALVLALLTLERGAQGWRVIALKREPVYAAPTPDPAALALAEPALQRRQAWLGEKTALRVARRPRRIEWEACAGTLEHLALTTWAQSLPDVGTHWPPDALTLLPYLWRGRLPVKAPPDRAITRRDVYRWMAFPEAPVRMRLSPRQVQVLLEPHARHVRGRKVPDTLVLWPGGFEAQIATGGSELPTLRRNGTRLEEIAQLETPAALSVWMTGYVRHGGGGLAPRALLHPSQQVSLPPGILP
ncbi:MAG: hypothetical protein OEW39_16190, partial [Deltaproteobacteria bacterium]|nr:hypothetical protein [Deltaproteobacteria bacterium]